MVCVKAMEKNMAGESICVGATWQLLSMARASHISKASEKENSRSLGTNRL